MSYSITDTVQSKARHGLRRRPGECCSWEACTLQHQSKLCHIQMRRRAVTATVKAMVRQGLKPRFLPLVRGCPEVPGVLCQPWLGAPGGPHPGPPDVPRKVKMKHRSVLHCCCISTQGSSRPCFQQEVATCTCCTQLYTTAESWAAVSHCRTLTRL